MAEKEHIASRLFLFLRNVFWTVLMPGTVTIYIPYMITTRWSPAGMTNRIVLLVPAVILIAAGAITLLYSIGSFAVTGRGTLSPLDAPRRLVVQGLYRYMRNPMYAGVMAILIGEAVLFGSGALAVYAAGVFLSFNLFILVYEEPTLRRKFGESYVRYCEAVGRWLPGKPYNEEDRSGYGRVDY